MVKVVTVIPAYNEERTVSAVVREAKRHSDDVVVVDDGSVDATARMARIAGASVVLNKRHLGLGAAIRRGYKEALRRGAGIVVQVDADGQYVVSDIPKLVRPILENRADMVIASRFLGGIEEMPFAKRVGNRVFTLLTGLVIGRQLSDAQSGFRAMRSWLVRKIIPEEDYGYTHEITIKAARNRARIVEVPSYFRKRQHGRSRLVSSMFKYAVREGKVILRALLRGR